MIKSVFSVLLLFAATLSPVQAAVSVPGHLIDPGTLIQVYQEAVDWGS